MPISNHRRVALREAVRRYRESRTEEQKAALRAAAAVRFARRRALLDSLEATACLDCGGSFPPECMDFDHRPGQAKVRDVGSMVTSAMETLLAEVAKCDLVCANCHRIRTRKRGIGRPRLPRAA